MSDRRTSDTDIRSNSGRGKSALSQPEFARRALIVLTLTTLFVVFTVAFVLASDVFFLIFLSIVVAVLLRGLADLLDSRTGLGPGWSLTVVIVGIAALLVSGIVGLGAAVAAQVNQLSVDLPRSIEQLRAYLEGREWGRQVIHNMPSAETIITNGQQTNLASQLASFFSTTLGVLGNIAVLIALSLYLAADPASYTNSILQLIPVRKRPRGEQVLLAVGHQLRRWLFGRLVAMVAIGLMTFVGLLALGVNQYLILSLLAAVLNIVPFIGPIIAAIPAILIGFMSSPALAIWVAALYIVVQLIENYLITPLVQQKAVDLSPALTIVAIVLTGTLFGVLALLVATPLAVTILVLVKMLYVEDVLGDSVSPEPPVAATGTSNAKQSHN